MIELVDLRVGDNTLYNVQLTILENGNYQYLVPDVVMLSPTDHIQQYTKKYPPSTLVKKTDAHKAMVDYLYKFEESIK